LANIQRHFDAFHRNIRLSREETRTLQQKRDIICNKLEVRLPRMFEEADMECPRFGFRDQGSYEMKTGTIPLFGGFDIDLGTYFEIDHNDYDPVGLKRVVHDALKGHTKEVTIRRPCVTVQYQHAGEPAYHVDIAVYADGSQCRDGLPRLAMGKDRSGENYCGWQVSDAMALRSEILGAYSREELTQFRHVVKYLKRWKDVRFKPQGNGAPRGIALTVACSQHFTAEFFRDGTPDDLGALIQVVSGLLESFTVRNASGLFGATSYDVQITLPVEPYSDLCERMTSQQVEQFYKQLESLYDVLDTVRRGRSQEKACQRLRRVFGTSFPCL